MLYETNTLAHHGVLGMKWGVRRYQRKDGSLTPKGKQHVSEISKKRFKRDERFKKSNKKLYSSLEDDKKQVINQQEKFKKDYIEGLDRMNNPDRKKFEKQARKDIDFEKDYLQESHDMGYGGINNPTDQDALNSLFNYDEKQKATFDNYVKLISEQETNNENLKKFYEDGIKRADRILEKVDDMTIYEMYKEGGETYNSVWELLNSGKLER